jgi:glycosyltransferase involved in cell wall biosynthesis
MPARLPLTVLIITLNEELNIARALKSVEWADEVLVIDSDSTDKTVEIAQSMGARVVQQPWLGYGQQKNFGMSQAKYDWVLSLDADEEVSSELRTAIAHFLSSDGLQNGKQYWGAAFPRKTFFLGRWIMHGGWYPNILTRLAHRKQSRWTEPKVHESLEVSGGVTILPADLFHYTFRSVGDQVRTNIKYAKFGALAAQAKGENGSLLKILLKPVGKFLETYVWKRGFLDGFPGFVISINAAHSIFMKYVELRLEQNSHHRQ